MHGPIGLGLFLGGGETGAAPGRKPGQKGVNARQVVRIAGEQSGEPFPDRDGATVRVGSLGRPAPEFSAPSAVKAKARPL
jgi:hypothetical protein